MNKEITNVHVPSILDVHQIYKKYTQVDILDSRRKRNIVDHRCMFVNLCVTYTKTSYAKLGKYLGKDHSSIVHYTKNFEAMAKYNKDAMKSFVKTELELLLKYPLIMSKYREYEFSDNNEEKEKRRFLRIIHANNIKINFYKGYTKKLESRLKKLKYERKLYQSQ